MANFTSDDEIESIDDAMFRAARLDRSELVKILESVGIQCYDTEDFDTLLAAIRANLLDGTLDQSAID